MASLDDVDLAVISALRVDARASFADIAQLAGVSDQTVARRYAALVRSEVLTLSVSSRASTSCFVRLTCTPATARRVATALTSRRDTRWVMVAAGGTEIVCLLETRAAAADELIFSWLPRSPGLVSLDVHTPLRFFVGGVVPWLGRAQGLTPGQQLRLRDPSVRRAAGRVPPLGSEVFDAPLIAALRAEPRLSTARLARKAGTSESTVRRRLAALRESGDIAFNLDVDAAALGWNRVTLLWTSVPLDALDAAGAELAQHPSVAMAAAVTGRTNLLVISLSHDTDELYRYLTEQFVRIGPVGSIETVPVHRILKRAASTSGEAPLS